MNRREYKYNDHNRIEFENIFYDFWSQWKTLNNRIYLRHFISLTIFCYAIIWKTEEVKAFAWYAIHFNLNITWTKVQTLTFSFSEYPSKRSFFICVLFFNFYRLQIHFVQCMKINLAQNPKYKIVTGETQNDSGKKWTFTIQCNNKNTFFRDFDGYFYPNNAKTVCLSTTNTENS